MKGINFQVGHSFPCFYSQKELGLVMTELDYNEVNMLMMVMHTISAVPCSDQGNIKTDSQWAIGTRRGEGPLN